MPWLDEPVDLVVEGWSSDSELDRIDDYHDELRTTLQLKPGAQIVQVSHDVTHLYSAFHPSPYDAAAASTTAAQTAATSGAGASPARSTASWLIHMTSQW